MEILNYFIFEILFKHFSFCRNSILRKFILTSCFWKDLNFIVQVCKPSIFLKFVHSIFVNTFILWMHNSFEDYIMTHELDPSQYHTETMSQIFMISHTRWIGYLRNLLVMKRSSRIKLYFGNKRFRLFPMCFSFP